MGNSTVFERIIRRELPSTVLFENERLIAIKDIHPLAPVHLLIITKKVIPSLQEIELEDLPLIGEIVQVAQQLARDQGLEEGYRLVTNVGREGGQMIPHLHFHLLGGRELGHEMG